MENYFSLFLGIMLLSTLLIISVGSELVKAINSKNKQIIKYLILVILFTIVDLVMIIMFANVILISYSIAIYFVMLITVSILVY